MKNPSLKHFIRTEVDWKGVGLTIACMFGLFLVFYPIWSDTFLQGIIVALQAAAFMAVLLFLVICSIFLDYIERPRRLAQVEAYNKSIDRKTHYRRTILNERYISLFHSDQERDAAVLETNREIQALTKARDAYIKRFKLENYL